MKTDIEHVRKNLERFAGFDCTEKTAKHCINALTNFPQNEWFTPRNGESMDYYSLCDTLHRAHLICKKITPIYNSMGNYAGQKVEFMYNLEFIY